jgi:hypothetical protein
MRMLLVAHKQKYPIFTRDFVAWYIYLLQLGLIPGGSSILHFYKKKCTEQHHEAEYTEYYSYIHKNKNVQT